MELKVKSSNINFYDNLGPDNLQKLATDVSFEEYYDLKRIKHLFKDANHILEIGAGYGRVLNYLTNNLYTKDISAIELSYKMASHLTLKFAQRAKIIHDDVLNLNFNYNKPDIILWMWSGFGDLNTKEQKESLEIINKNSSPNSKLIIDIPDVGTMFSGNKNAKIGNFININEAIIEHPIYGLYKAYFPTIIELNQIINESSFSNSKVDRYSIKGSYRVQFIISK